MAVDVSWSTPDDVQNNWFLHDWERRDGVDRLRKDYPDLRVRPAMAEVTIDSVAYSLNAVLKTLQDAMGQHDGFVAGQFTSDGWEIEMSVLLAADILHANGKGHIPDWDGSLAYDLGKKVGIGELSESDVSMVIDSYLGKLAEHAKVPTSAFGTGSRLKLMADMLAYIDLERAFAVRDASNDQAGFPAP